MSALSFEYLKNAESLRYRFLGQGKSMSPLSANANVLSATPHLLVTR
jgi:hypothetical protein